MPNLELKAAIAAHSDKKISRHFRAISCLLSGKPRIADSGCYRPSTTKSAIVEPSSSDMNESQAAGHAVSMSS